ncbi:male-specific histamine-binding salivary protein-like [Ixodes scapularis]|uniref:male-specific histamine-binding salivary protein-like n=1 Tax=Ixodes scapularis TaxID=6945 RepID=UPI001A9E722D|nr:male-specific histamine-binding salivary protein-like [Ixodes scapularis]
MKLFAVALRLFATLMGMPLAANTRPIGDSWLLSKEVGYFQNASEVINQDGIYFLVLGTQYLPYDCVGMEVTARAVREKAIRYKIMYFNSSQTTELTGSAYVASDVRGQETVIYMTIDGYGSRSENHVLYEEKNKCYILYNPETEQFELWVSQNEITFLPRCCEFAYWLATYGRKTHILYNKYKCKLVL